MLVKTRFIPGEQYVYEKVDGVTYARRHGDPPSARFEIGRDSSGYGTMYGLPLSELEQLAEMSKFAKKNETLQKSLNQCIMMYLLMKNHGSET